MKWRLIVQTTILGALLLYVAQSFGDAPESEEAKLSREIKKELEALHGVLDQRRSERENVLDAKQKLEGQIAKLRESKNSLDETLAKDRKTIAGLENREQDLTTQINEARQSIKEAAECAIPIVNNFALRVSSGIPHNKSARLSKLNSIKGALENLETENKARGLQDFFAFCGEELRLASSIQIWNESLFLNGGETRKHAYLIRLGLAGEYFVSEDAGTIGMAAMEEDLDWKLDISEEEKKQILACLDCLQGKKVSGMELLPFALSGSSPRGGK